MSDDLALVLWLIIPAFFALMSFGHLAGTFYLNGHPPGRSFRPIYTFITGAFSLAVGFLLLVAMMVVIIFPHHASAMGSISGAGGGSGPSYDVQIKFGAVSYGIGAASTGFTVLLFRNALWHRRQKAADLAIAAHADAPGRSVP